MKVTCRALLAMRGEAVVALAEQVIRRYGAADGSLRLRFFEYLAHDLDCDPQAVKRAADAYRNAPRSETLRRLRETVETPRLHLFRALNTPPATTSALVEMRAAVLELVVDHPELQPVEEDLFHVLSSWFNRGFMRVRRIDWTASAQIVEKLIEYEAVHEIRGWGDLRRRLQEDRRCFAFFHPALPDDPIIFVEVALTNELTDRISKLIDQAPPADPLPAFDTAIFYSINNCQPGLRGIEFGNFLLKRVIDILRAENPELQCFSTLSPVPGLVRWLRANHDDPALAWLNYRAPELAAAIGPDWSPSVELVTAHGAALETACAQYLLEAKSGIAPLDPVARFHLRNGARLQRINPLGDISPNGLRRSAGVLVNYVYSTDQLQANHEAFVNSGDVARHPTVDAALAARSGSDSATSEVT